MSVTFTVTNTGLKRKLDLISGFVGSGFFFGGLYTNTFSDLTTVNYAALTEPTFPGYSHQVQTSYGTSGGSSSTLASLSIASVTFTCTSTFSPAQTITGGYIADTFPGTEVIAVVNLPGGPAVVSQPGDSIVLQCTITDQRA